MTPTLSVVVALMAAAACDTGQGGDGTILDPSDPARYVWIRGDKVLDGDTLLVAGRHIRVAGVDAPELGPRARCWAEAALAGHAKSYVERELSDGSWRLADVSRPDVAGKRSASIVRGDGQGLADLLVVYGYAANTTGRWDWCGTNAKLHSPAYDERPPYGPNLWWPTGKVFDARAFD